MRRPGSKIRVSRNALRSSRRTSSFVGCGRNRFMGRNRFLGPGRSRGDPPTVNARRFIPMEASFEFPTAQSDDASDVAVALETAKALWRRGDSREALRWLRRAAARGDPEGDDLRAVALARAAADLQDRLPH